MARTPKWRREGYATEYAYRTRGLSDPEAKRAAAGHRGRRDLESTLASGRAESVTVVQTGRGLAGRFRTVTVSVRTADGRVRQYTLRGKAITTPELKKLGAQIGKSGATFTPPYRDPKGKPQERANRFLRSEERAMTREYIEGDTGDER